jgi:hypothetical protein
LAGEVWPREELLFLWCPRSIPCAWAVVSSQLTRAADFIVDAWVPDSLFQKLGRLSPFSAASCEGEKGMLETRTSSFRLDLPLLFRRSSPLGNGGGGIASLDAMRGRCDKERFGRDGAREVEEDDCCVGATNEEDGCRLTSFCRGRPESMGDELKEDAMGTARDRRRKDAKSGSVGEGREVARDGECRGGASWKLVPAVFTFANDGLSGTGADPGGVTSHPSWKLSLELGFPKSPPGSPSAHAFSSPGARLFEEARLPWNPSSRMRSSSSQFSTLPRRDLRAECRVLCGGVGGIDEGDVTGEVISRW